MAPSQLKIATSALQRLLKEEQSYYKEQEQQEARIAKLESEANGNSDGNYEYSLRQEVSVFFSCDLGLTTREAATVC